MLSWPPSHWSAWYISTLTHHPSSAFAQQSWITCGILPCRKRLLIHVILVMFYDGYLLTKVYSIVCFCQVIEFFRKEKITSSPVYCDIFYATNSQNRRKYISTTWKLSPNNLGSSTLTSLSFRCLRNIYSITLTPHSDFFFIKLKQWINTKKVFIPDPWMVDRMPNFGFKTNPL